MLRRNEKRVDCTLYLVTDRPLSLGRSSLEVIEAAVEGGVTMVQVREKQAATRDFYREGVKIRDFLGSRGIPLIVNDRVDIALALDADGVHLGQEDMPLAVARKILGPGKIIGISVFHPEEARQAEEEGADYLGLSPVFLTATKPDLSEQLGLEGIPPIRRAVKIPLVGIGGIAQSNAHAVVRAGLDGVAVVSAICSQRDPKAAAEALRTEVLRALSERAHGRRKAT